MLVRRTLLLQCIVSVYITGIPVHSVFFRHNSGFLNKTKLSYNAMLIQIATIYLSVSLAGADGFEPPIQESKSCALTIWRYPFNIYNYNKQQIPKCELRILGKIYCCIISANIYQRASVLLRLHHLFEQAFYFSASFSAGWLN